MNNLVSENSYFKVTDVENESFSETSKQLHYFCLKNKHFQ